MIWRGAHIVNPVVDGLFYVAVQHEGHTWLHYGRFVRIEPPRQVEHTWVSEANGVVTVTFEPRGVETEFTLRHSGVPDAEMDRPGTRRAGAGPFRSWLRRTPANSRDGLAATHYSGTRTASSYNSQERFCL